ncbi:MULTISPECIES: acyltransferase family protein [unclassified Providencia]|uniref:acyltransferase family protein n=2 Tax=Providencia TaxID=586 RepID=UPI001BAB52BC|nr:MULTISPECIES: acyltransferase family protein [unclassified Providencia]
MIKGIFGSTVKTKKPNYLPEVDGLRAIAVLLVLIFHLNPTGFFSGGFIGVDIFFVISGFLITGIIYEKTLNNSFSYIKFIEFRISRLYPALLFIIALTLIVSFIIYSPDYYSNSATAAEYSLFSIGNLFFASEKGYWDLDSISNPFLHTWSLGVEQQFYLIWPLLIILTCKLSKKQLLNTLILTFSILFILTKSPNINQYFSFFEKNLFLVPLILFSLYISNDKNKLITVLIIVSLLSLYLAETMSTIEPTKSFYYMPTRIFELGAGGIWYIYNKNSNFLSEKVRNIHKEILFLLGILFIFVIAFYYHGDIESHPGIVTIPVVFSTILCIYGGSARYSGIITRNKLFVFIGLISYSVYLIHWPIIVFYKYITFSNEITIKAQILILILTFTLAFVVYYLIENKYRRFSFSLKSKSLYIFIIVFISIVSFSKYSIEFKNKNIKTVESYSSWTKEEYCKKVESSSGIPWACVSGSISSKNKYLVIGDSHAAQLIPFYDYIGKRNDIEFTVIAAPHCIPINGFDVKKSSNSNSCQKSIEFAESIIPKFKTIIMNGIWEDAHTNNDNFKKNLKNFLNNTEKNNQKVIFVSAIPKLQSDPKGLKDSYFLRYFANIKTLHTPIDANNAFSKIISGHDNAEFIDLYDSEAFKSIPFYNGELMFFDHYHLNAYGAITYAKYSEKKLIDSLR